MIRKVNVIYKGRDTLEGAGVRLKRIFGYYEVPLFDPFLMLDDFGSHDPQDYIAGFPWHPHRGIETVTYMLHGTVSHGDSMGNKGKISDGQVQWMTAGSGIIHQEMPQEQEDYLRGFQLWVNLPAKNKMMNPRYQDIQARDIPEFQSEEGVKVRVIAGRYRGFAGPVKDIICEPEYLDVHVPRGLTFEHPVKKGHAVFAYAIEGEGMVGPDRKKIQAGTLALLGDGEKVVLEANPSSFRFLLVSGKPIGEPVAWQGPIVMNTEEELTLAFKEYRNGTFIK
jgi:redox-sensitive bicupin YhaK (pirin superfamily)